MTEGDPVLQIIKFTIPMLLGNIAQQLYNTVDSIIVGRFVGDNALAAVGSAGPILNLMLVLFMGVSVGASIMVSQFFGARQRESLSKSIGTCVVLTGVASLIIMIVGPMVTMPLLRLLRTPESIILWCRNYLIIICLGIAGGGYYNILSGVLRGLGDSMSALIYLLVATGINIVLDYAFVAYLGLGVAGVALATIIAQFVSAFLSLRRLKKMTEYFDMKREYLAPDSASAEDQSCNRKIQIGISLILLVDAHSIRFDQRISASSDIFIFDAFSVHGIEPDPCSGLVFPVSDCSAEIARVFVQSINYLFCSLSVHSFFREVFSVVIFPDVAGHIRDILVRFKQRFQIGPQL